MKTPINVSHYLFFLSFFILSQNILFASGEGEGDNDGLSCETAFQVDTNDIEEFTFSEGQHKQFFKFQATGQEMVFQLSASSQSPFAAVYEVDIYQLESCEGKSLIHSITVNEDHPANFFKFYLTAEQDYLAVLKRDQELSLPTAYYDLILLQGTPIPCPSNYNLTCGELIRNGEFELLTTTIPSFGDAFSLPRYPPNAQSNVCEWENSFGTCGLAGSSSNYYAKLYYFNAVSGSN